MSVMHLERLGFDKETARNALIYARNDVALAIDLAIHDTHSAPENPDCPVCKSRKEGKELRQWFVDQKMRPQRKGGIIEPHATPLSIASASPHASTILRYQEYAERDKRSDADSVYSSPSASSSVSRSSSFDGTPSPTASYASHTALPSSDCHGMASPPQLVSPTTPTFSIYPPIPETQAVGGMETLPRAPRAAYDPSAYTPVYVPLNDDVAAGSRRYSSYSEAIGASPSRARTSTGAISTHEAVRRMRASWDSPGRIGINAEAQISGTRIPKSSSVPGNMRSPSPSEEPSRSYAEFAPRRGHPRVSTSARSSFYEWYNARKADSGDSPTPARLNRSGSVGKAI